MEVEVKQQWMNVLDPVRLKPNLELISLYITLYEMLKIIAGGLDEGFYEDFNRMYALFCKIERWWILENELPLNPDFDNCDKEIDEDGVMSGNMIVLSAMMDIVNTGSNKLYEEVCKKWGVEVNG